MSTQGGSFQLEEFENHEDHCPAASNGVSVRLGELFTHIMGMADFVKQVQIEVTQLQDENKVLRKKQMLAEGGERTLKVTASSIDSDAFDPGREPMAPWVADLPHAPTEPPPELQEGLNIPSPLMAANKAKKQVRVSVPEEPHLKRRSTNSFKSDLTILSTASTDTATIKKQVHQLQETFKRQHTFEPKNKAKRSQLAWAPGFRDSEVGHHFGARFGLNHPQGRRSSIRDSAVRAMLFDPEALKQKTKENITKPDFNIARYYWADGYAQMIARSNTFESISTIVIFLNTIWIAVDTEHNQADVLLDAATPFQIIEHCFCLIFFLEWTIRFAAFQRKRDCLRSGWFILESSLVMTMVFEDWIVTLILISGTGSGGGGTGAAVVKDVAILRILRVIRLARLGRAVKLLRQSPEMMIMVKALIASARSVFWTCVLLASVIFFYGVCFTQICKDSPLEDEYFGSLTSSLHTLMIAGLFPDLDMTSQTIKETHFVYWSIFVVYLVMTGITVMNLLVGVLVEVAQSSARTERNNLDASYVKDVFVETLCLWEVEDFGVISVAKEEFADLLQEPEILKALTKTGIDVFGLIDLMDFIFMNGSVGFVELLEIVLQLRSSADVTVRDLVEVRKFLTYEMSKLKSELT